MVKKIIVKLKVPRSSQSFLDADYLKKLSKEEREWYYLAMDEMYCNGQYRKEGTLHEEAGIQNYKSELNKNSKARRRDIYAGGTQLSDIQDEVGLEYKNNDYEEKSLTEIINDKAVYLVDFLNNCKENEKVSETLNIFREILYSFSSEIKRKNKESNKIKNDKRKLKGGVIKTHPKSIK